MSIKSKLYNVDTIYDSTLVARFKSGDVSAFTEIDARHRKNVFGVAFPVLKNRAEAEDITQDTMLNTYKGLPKFREDSSLATWMYQIAFNLARNRYWYHVRRSRSETLPLDRPIMENGIIRTADVYAMERSGPIHDVPIKESVEIISLGIQRLDRDQREALTLYAIADQSYVEIAAILGIRVGTVKSRIARARSNLKVFLFNQCPELLGKPDSEIPLLFGPQRDVRSFV
jgi:RNA polymerase sigma-70 factor, ECF subfamily